MSTSFQLQNNTLKELPHNIEAEQGILGAILLNNEIFFDISETINVEHFYEPVHKLIFDVIGKLISKGQIATPITLKSFFEVEKNLEEIGGSNYLVRLANSAVSLDYAKNYAHIIYNLAVRRGLYELGGKVQHDAIESEIEIKPEDLIEEAEKNLYQISEKGTSQNQVQTFQTSVEEAIELAKKAFEKDSSVVGISSDFTDLDAKLGGFHPSDLIIIAGRPSMGKTSLATNIAFNIARNAHISKDMDASVLFFSLEMSSEQLARRILSEQARISSNDIRRGNLSENDLDNLVSVSKDILEKIPSVELISGDVFKFDFKPNVVIDAILGTGITGEIREPYASAIDFINQVNCFKFAVDVPSGLDPQTGNTANIHTKCDITVSFHKMKQGIPKRKDLTGELFVEKIGIPPEAENGIL